MMKKEEIKMIVIVDAVRTAMGGFQGSLSSCTAPDLGAVAIKEVVARAGLTANDNLLSKYASEKSNVSLRASVILIPAITPSA